MRKPAVEGGGPSGSRMFNEERSQRPRTDVRPGDSASDHDDNDGRNVQRRIWATAPQSAAAAAAARKVRSAGPDAVAESDFIAPAEWGQPPIALRPAGSSSGPLQI